MKCVVTFTSAMVKIVNATISYLEHSANKENVKLIKLS